MIENTDKAYALIGGLSILCSLSQEPLHERTNMPIPLRPSSEFS